MRVLFHWCVHVSSLLSLWNVTEAFSSVSYMRRCTLKQWRHDFVTLWIIRKRLLRKCIRMPDIGWLTGCDLDNDDQLNMYWAKCWLYAEHLFTFVSTLLDAGVGGLGGWVAGSGWVGGGGQRKIHGSHSWQIIGRFALSWLLELLIALG